MDSAGVIPNTMLVTMAAANVNASTFASTVRADTRGTDVGAGSTSARTNPMATADLAVMVLLISWLMTRPDTAHHQAEQVMGASR
jgi:hypothetical protein